MKKLYQYRYYGNFSNKNYPRNLNNEILMNGELFRNKGSITHLGIQAIPETEFFLNREDNPIYIGKTGIFEIDVEGYGFITSVSFSENTLQKVHEGNGIIIDIIHEGGTFE